MSMLDLQSKGTEDEHGQAADGAEGSGGSGGDGGRLRLVGGGLDDVGGRGKRDGSRLHGSLDGLGLLGSRLGLVGSSGLSGLGLLSRLGLLGGSGGAGLLAASRGRVGAELLSSGEDLVDGDVGTAVLQDLSGGLALDLVKVLANAGKIGGLAVGVVGDGLVKGRESALGDIREGLGLRNGGEGNGSESVLHLD
jgi:hypothetical protein